MPCHWQGKKTHAEQFTRKMTRDQRVLIYRLHAEGFSEDQIQEEMKVNQGIDIPGTTLHLAIAAKKARPYIEKFKEDYLAKVKAVPIANKRIRLDDLETTRLKLQKMIEKTPIETKQQRAELLMMMRRLNETICVARDEMENKPMMIQQVSVSELRDFSDEALQKRKDELIGKELGTFKGRDFGIGADTEGNGLQDKPESPEVPVAAPEKL